MNPAAMKQIILSILTLAIIQVSVAQEASTSISISDESGRKASRYRTSLGIYDFDIEYRGKIEVDDDDKDIKSLSDDGYIEISKSVFGSKRTIIIEPAGDGKLRKEYYEGRKKIEWEPNGREWLGEILPGIVRTTALGAESRINRYYAKGGVSAVMGEIGRLEGDYVRSQYGKLLFEKPIAPSELPSVIKGLGNAIKSDYYLSTLFKNNIEKLLSTSEAADAFFQATTSISSDYYKSVILKEALKKHATTTAQATVVLKSARSINSDYYLSVVLTALLSQSTVKSEVLAEMISVSTEISSDYYRAVVLNKVLKIKNVSAATLTNIADAASSINSDYYKSTVFTNLAKQSALDEAAQSKIINAIGNSMNSAYYASVSLSELIKNQKLTEKSFSELVTVAAKLSSANYAADVLQNASRTTLTPTQLVEICKATATIRSDYYLSNVLTAIAPQVRNSDSNVKDAYRQAAKRIGSETYYGRAVRAID
jgi:hypothetical protein